MPNAQDPEAQARADEMVWLRSVGATVKQVAAHYGVSRTRVNQLVLKRQEERQRTDGLRRGDVTILLRPQGWLAVDAVAGS